MSAENSWFEDVEDVICECFLEYCLEKDPWEAVEVGIGIHFEGSDVVGGYFIELIDGIWIMNNVEDWLVTGIAEISERITMPFE